MGNEKINIVVLDDGDTYGTLDGCRLVRVLDSEVEVIGADAQDQCSVEVATVASRAIEAFWFEVVRCYPAARTGDLSPGTSFALEQLARVAVAEWAEANVPEIM